MNITPCLPCVLLATQSVYSHVETLSNPSSGRPGGTSKWQVDACLGGSGDGVGVGARSGSILIGFAHVNA